MPNCVREKGLGTAVISLKRRPSPSMQGTGRSLDPPENAEVKTLQIRGTDKQCGVLENIWT